MLGARARHADSREILAWLGTLRVPPDNLRIEVARSADVAPPGSVPAGSAT